ncbi:MAG: YecA family protein, partial [Turicibacter sp.]
MQNMSDVLKDAMKANAIKSEHQADVEIILGKLKKNDLKAIVDAHGLKGCSSFAKPKLIERILETLGDVDRLKYILCGLDEKMEAVLMALMNQSVIAIDEVEVRYLHTLYQLGYVYPVVEKKEVAIVLPQVVRDAYAQINKNEFDSMKKRYDLIYTYMRALINMYGICEMEQLVAVFNEYEAQPLTFDEAMEVLFCKVNFHPYVQAYGPLLVCDSLLVFDDEDVLKLHEKQLDKPYYMPTKEEVLTFGEGLGEWTSQLLKVKEYVLKNICEDENMATEIVSEMGDAFTYQYEPKLAFMALEKRSIELSSFELGQGLMLLLMEASNFARTWENRGFRPSEIAPSKA